MIFRNLSRADLRSLFAFGTVGVAATAVHFAIGLTLAGPGGLAPFQANIGAFLTAFLVSYFGHHRFTFRSTAAHSRAAPRFLAVALGGLALNQIIVYLCVDRLGLSYALAIGIVVCLVPVIIYAAGRLWAFREPA